MRKQENKKMQLFGATHRPSDVPGNFRYSAHNLPQASYGHTAVAIAITSSMRVQVGRVEVR